MYILHTKSLHLLRVMIITGGACLLTLTDGCNENSVTPNEHKKIDTVFASSHFLWPSGKGSYWVYDHYTIPGFGNNDTAWTYENFTSFGLNLDSTTTNNIFELIISNTLDVMINDTLFNSCHVISFKYNNQDTDFNELFWIGYEGVFSLGAFNEDGDSLRKKGLYIPNSSKINEPWTSQSIFKSTSGFLSIRPEDKRLVSIENINANGNEFNCYVIRTIIDPKQDYPGYYYYYEYYAPNIGLVVKVRIFILPKEYWTLDYVQVLKSYHLVGINFSTNKNKTK